MTEPTAYRPTPDDLYSQQQLLTLYRRNLAVLLAQQARYGSADVPPRIALEIADTQAHIHRVKQTLQSWNVAVADHPDDTVSAALTQPDAAEWQVHEAAPNPNTRLQRDVQSLRLAPYGELWKLLKPLARYDLPEPLTVAMLDSLSIALRDWYFDIGGLFLSEHSRGPYFELKELLRTMTAQKRQQTDLGLSNDEVAQVLAAASALRTQLAKDLGTR